MTPPLWSSADLRAALRPQHADPFAATGVSIDTRTLQRGDLFVALHGPNFDGHDFVDQAMAAGAAGVVSARALAVPHIRVDDPFEALQALARAARARFNGDLIAITGSVGKTSTKELTAAAFGAFCRVHATPGNLNNQFGVPLTLANMSQDTQVAVVEMGMNHFGEIADLSRLARPTKALITAIDWVHSENLDGTLAGVARAKAEICQGLRGTLIAPTPLRKVLAPHLGRADCLWVSAPYQGTLQLDRPEQRWNAALALATVPPAHQHAAALAMASLPPLPGRGRLERVRIDGQTVLLVDDAYNAAPASMRAALHDLSLYRGGRKIAVVGDMAELAQAAKHHRDLGHLMGRLTLDFVLAVGRFQRDILGALPPTLPALGLATPQEAFAALRARLQDQDKVLIKASHSTGLGRLAQDLRRAGQPDNPHP